MKNSRFTLSQIFLTNLCVFFCLLILLIPTYGVTQSFQRFYGNSTDDSFSKVIKDGANYYVLGQNAAAPGDIPDATVTRLDAQGLHEWTLTLNVGSIWNDAILIPGGDLLVVGSTLPFDATTKSLMGRVTSSGGGNFTWLRSYDQPGRDHLTRIVENPVPENGAFPYYVLGSQNEPGASATTEDVVLFNLDANGNFNWKKIYPNPGDDEFFRDLDVLANGDLLLAGNGIHGLIYKTDNGGNAFSGAQIPLLTFNDLGLESSGGVYATANNAANNEAHILKLDNDLILIWDVIIPQLTSISQVWEGIPGEIYATGRGSFGGSNRDVIIKLLGNGPSIIWMKYLNAGSGFKGGSSWLMPNNEIAFTDARVILGGLGGDCAFISVSDNDLLDACLVSEDMVSLILADPIPDGPDPPNVEFQDFPMGTNLFPSALDWLEGEVCNNEPCGVTITLTDLNGCGLIQATANATGPGPYTYQWCDGQTSSSYTTNLPCGDHEYCVSVTCSDGTVSSATASITVADTIPPLAVCIPPEGVVLDTNCMFIVTVAMIDGGSSDNCQIQSMSVIPTVLNGCGIFPITLTVTDWCGNVSTCTTEIQTIENVPPMIICPPNVVVTSNSSAPCEAVVDDIQWLSATDNCSIPSVTYSTSGATTLSGNGDASGQVFNQGLTTVTYTAMDECGNTASCSFTVQILCQACCDETQNIIANGSFTGIPGGNFPTNAVPWYSANESPQASTSDGCSAPGMAQLWGNSAVGEVLGQIGTPTMFKSGWTYQISFCAKYLNINNPPLPPNLAHGWFNLEAANGSSTTNGPSSTCTGCATIGQSQVLNQDNVWESVCLPAWTANADYDRLFINFANTSLANNPDSISWARIDDICIQVIDSIGCCNDFDAFCQKVEAAVTITTDPDSCKAKVNIDDLGICDGYIESVSWGDGQTSQGPYPSNSMAMHVYPASGSYEICYLAIELDSAGFICFEKFICDTIDIVCDICTCGTYSDMSYRPFQGAPNISAECGNTLTAQCNGLTPWNLSGNFLCDGDSCPDSTQMSWTLIKPTGTSSGAMVADPGFGISILPGEFNTSGTYNLILSAICGQDTCYCEFSIVVECDTCCVDFDAFCQNVEDAVTITTDPDSCKAKINIYDLGDCDRYIESIDWGDGSTSQGTYSSGSMAMHVYSGSGSYTVCYLAIELDDAGFICFEKIICDTIDILCYTCCTDFDAFCQNVEGGVTITTDTDSCKAKLNIDLGNCNDYLEYVDWGDGSSSQGPYTSGSMAMHVYPDSGVYVVCYLAIEVDSAGFICFEKFVCDTIDLQCGTVAVIDLPQSIMIRAFPNPTLDKLSLQFEELIKKDSKLHIIDIWGRTIETVSLQSGEGQHELSMASLPTGVYLIKITVNGAPIWIEKIIKQ